MSNVGRILLSAVSNTRLADAQPFSDYYEREYGIELIHQLLHLDYETCKGLYIRMREDVARWTVVSMFSSFNPWEIAWERAKLMMAKGNWKYEEWMEFVRQINSIQYQQEWGFDFNWERIPEIEF